MKLLQIFLLCLLTLGMSYAVPVCRQNICALVLCAAVDSCSTGTLVKHGGFCGCCDACVTELAAGESCDSELLGALVTSKCADGLFCEHSSLTCKPLIF